MEKPIDWMKKTTFRLTDPVQAARVSQAAEAVWGMIDQQRRGFDFRQAQKTLRLDPADVRLVAERVYEIGVGRAWRDFRIDDREQHSLQVLADLLWLRYPQTIEIKKRVGLAVFREYLMGILADGVVDQNESAFIQQMAASLGGTIRQVITEFFLHTAEEAIRSTFAADIAAGASEEKWRRLVLTAQGLGLTEQELSQLVAPQAKQYVEHVLTDAKSDGTILEQEAERLRWLITLFGLDAEFAAYVEAEVRTVNLLMDVQRGTLPSIEVPGMSLRAGEMVHHRCYAIYILTKMLRYGPERERHDGEIFVTDCRLLFVSHTKTIELNHRRVVALVPFDQGMEVRASGKGSGTYYLGGSPLLGTTIYDVVVRRANQKLVAPQAGQASRKIPRDVRQRVWQRYGGRCADCGADQYLEFDHIVPFSKGGSSTDENVQLLCRACNLKKSDMI